MPITKSPNTSAMTSTIRNEAKAAITDHVKGVAMAHENLVRPWKKAEDKPRFDIEIEMGNGEIIGLVIHRGQEAEDASISVWQLLDRGTKIRYMQVSQDPQWVSKTWPGRTTSGAGAGFKEGLDFKNPRGGIAKRDFAKNIGLEAEPAARTFVEQGYSKGFKRVFR